MALTDIKPYQHVGVILSVSEHFEVYSIVDSEIDSTLKVTILEHGNILTNKLNVTVHQNQEFQCWSTTTCHSCPAVIHILD